MEKLYRVTVIKADGSREDILAKPTMNMCQLEAWFRFSPRDRMELVVYDPRKDRRSGGPGRRATDARRGDA